MLFEAIYAETIVVVFGKNGLGEDLIRHLFAETGIFNDYYGNFDDVLLDENSPWFKNVDRETQLREALERGLAGPGQPYGQTRKYDLTNIFFGGRLPAFFGFDVKNRMLPGNRATIPQGQIFKNAGRVTTFSPSFRMIVEIEKDEMQTNIAGGPSGKRFSKWYKSDFENWEAGRYKTLV
jgi:penicillin amidase